MLLAVADLTLLTVASVLLAVGVLLLTVSLLAHLLQTMTRLLLKAVADLLLSVAHVLLNIMAQLLLLLTVASLLLTVSDLLHAVTHALLLTVAHLRLTVTNLLITVDIHFLIVSGMIVLANIELLQRRVLIVAQNRCILLVQVCHNCTRACLAICLDITGARLNWNDRQGRERIQVVAPWADILSVHDVCYSLGLVKDGVILIPTFNLR